MTATAVGFVTTPLLIRALGVESFGALGILSSVSSYAQLLDLGIGLAGMKLISEHRLPHDAQDVNRIASNVLAAYSMLSVVVVVIGLLLAPALISTFHVPDDLDGQFRASFFLTIVSIAVVLSSASFTGMLFGIQEFKRLNLAIMGQSLLASIGGLIVARVTHDLLAVTAWTALVVLWMWLVKYLILRARGVHPNPRRADRKTIRTILAFSSSTFVISVASRMIFETDALVIGVLGTVTSVGLYTAASNPALALRKVGEQLTSVVLTSSSRLHAEGRVKELRELAHSGMKYSALLMFPAVAAVAVLSHDFLRTWVGSRFEVAGPSLLLLTAAVAVHSVQTTPAQILLSTGRQRALARVMILEAVLNLALSVVLFKRFGITGVALATFVPSLVIACTFTIPLTMRDLGMSLSALARCFGSPAFASVTAGFLLWGVLGEVTPHSLLGVAAVGLVFLSAYALLVVVIDRDVRDFLAGLRSA